MYALPIQTESFSLSLSSWFQNQNNIQDGYNRLQQFYQQSLLTYSPLRSELDYQPLTDVEEKRWKVLERKASQENLTSIDSREHELLLSVKFYHRLKREQPDLSHMQLLEIIQQSL